MKAEPEMSMGPKARKSVLVVHVATSVGWMGAVAAFLALAIVGLAAVGESGRDMYAAMDVIAWWVILPLALASLSIGVAQALGTWWGLLRHNWVVAKLLLTTVAVAVLLAKLALISRLADSGPAALIGPSMTSARLEVAVHAGGGLLVLLVALVLSVVKPRGLSWYARRSEPSRGRRSIEEISGGYALTSGDVPLQ